MSYWLFLSGRIHGTEIRPRIEPYEYDRVSPDKRFKVGDIVYLSWGGKDLYAWGFVVSKKYYRDEEIGEDLFKVKVAWQPPVRDGLVRYEQISQAPELASLFTSTNRNLVLLTAVQVNAFNQLLRSQGVEAPADVPSAILLAEPREDSAALMKLYLEKVGYRIYLARDGQEAVKKTQELKPDLIILETIMPLMNGLEACKVIKSDEETRAIPLIFLSADDRGEIRSQALSLGADRYLTKPIDPQKLLEYISEIFGTELIRKEYAPTIVDPAHTSATVGVHKNKDPYRIIGTKLNKKYELIEYAGSGGMGVVYRALGSNNQDIFAIKILKPDVVAKNPEYAELFEREAKTVKSLYHPHIVKVHDSGKDDDLSYMVMEWVDGNSIEEVLTQITLPLNRLTNIFEQVCRAVAYAHERSVIHLDIKPANILILKNSKPDDFVKVIDFGLSRVISRESGTTVTRFRGTHQYCAPEQFGGKVSLRSDIYSLGATLYHLITGVIPFGTSYINAKIHANLELPEIPSVTSQRDVPPALDDVIRKALNKNPELRQQSANQLFEEFKEAIT